MSPRALFLAATAAFALVLAGCGEKPQVTLYKQGKYQGKPDNVPWQSAPFSNDEVEWQKTIKARNNGQNEYLRIENQ